MSASRLPRMILRDFHLDTNKIVISIVSKAVITFAMRIAMSSTTSASENCG